LFVGIMYVFRVLTHASDLQLLARSSKSLLMLWWKHWVAVSRSLCVASNQMSSKNHL